MAEQISTDNTKKLLLEGTGEKQAPRPQPMPAQKKRRADVVVENATEKRYLWTARAFAVVFAISLCCNLLLTFTIMNTMPLYRVEPFLLSFADKSEQIYRVEQVKNIYERKSLTELFVREYVILRNSFVGDVDEMEKRWGVGGRVQELSSPKVYQNFKENVADKILELIRQRGITRDIKILAVNEVAGGKTGEVWWQVEFRMTDMQPDKEAPTVSIWQAHVGIKYLASRKVTLGNRLKNPLGFTVVKYTVEQRKQM